MTEIKERFHREKNIVITGVPESKELNQTKRSAADTQEIMYFIKTIYPEQK
jgi:hypothetical protein